VKRFLAFYGSSYYASGGMADFVGDFSTLEEAIAQISNSQLQHPHRLAEPWRFDWGHVYDVQERRIIWNSGERVQRNHIGQRVTS